MKPELLQTEIKQNKKTIPELSYESQLLYERLKTLNVNDFVPYGELSDLIGREVQKYRGHLTTAIRKCRTSDHIIIATVRNEGVKRLADEEVVKASGQFAQHVRRMARVEKQKLTSVDYDKLSKDLQVVHNARLSQYGVLNFFATENAAKKIEQKVADAQKQLPIGKTLEMFK